MAVSPGISSGVRVALSPYYMCLSVCTRAADTPHDLPLPFQCWRHQAGWTCSLPTVLAEMLVLFLGLGTLKSAQAPPDQELMLAFLLWALPDFSF